MSDTIDQYDLLRRTFDKLGVGYEEYLQPPRMDNRSTDENRCLELIANDCVAEFWFINGGFSSYVIYEQ